MLGDPISLISINLDLLDAMLLNCFPHLCGKAEELGITTIVTSITVLFSVSDGQDHLSTLNCVVPEVVSRRTGRVPSLRRLVRSTISVHQASRRFSDPDTPPPPYAEGKSFSELPNLYSAAHSYPPCPSPQQAQRHLLAKLNHPIKWNRVVAGIEVLRRATCEVPCDLDFARTLYLDGVCYILQSLPPNLTVKEQHRIASFLPSLAPPADNIETAPVLQRLTAATTMHSILVAAALVLHLRRLAATLYAFDRDHSVSERVLAAAAKIGIVVLEQLSQEEVRDAAGRIAFGVTRGVREGYAAAWSKAGLS